MGRLESEDLPPYPANGAYANYYASVIDSKYFANLYLLYYSHYELT